MQFQLTEASGAPPTPTQPHLPSFFQVLLSIFMTMARPRVQTSVTPGGQAWVQPCTCTSLGLHGGSGTSHCGLSSGSGRVLTSISLTFQQPSTCCWARPSDTAFCLPQRLQAAHLETSSPGVCLQALHIWLPAASSTCILQYGFQQNNPDRCPFSFI